MSEQDQTRNIPIDQLRVGLYIHLDMSWMGHGFARNSFKIKDEAELAEVRRLGLKTIRVNPKLSDAPPSPVLDQAKANTEMPEAGSAKADKAADKAALEAKKSKEALLIRLSEQQAALAQCERQFAKSVSSLRNLTKNLFARPEEAIEDANAMVAQMVESMMTDHNVATHLMNDRLGGEDMYLHTLNVTVLAMMVARKLNFDEKQLHALGIGCLFHDLGKTDIAAAIVNKMEPLSRIENNAMRLHCELGVKIGARMGFPREALEIMLQHHENFDGSGYPKGLKGEAITPLARIVAIVNTYDNLINPTNPAYALTPFEALSRMFKQLRPTFDPASFNVFIRCLGIYPPGTLLKLSDGTFGMAVAVNSAAPMRPQVLIYDIGVPKSEAIVVDLEKETSLTVAGTVTAQQLSREAYEYLSPKKRQVYFSHATDRSTNT